MKNCCTNNNNQNNIYDEIIIIFFKDSICKIFKIEIYFMLKKKQIFSLVWLFFCECAFGTYKQIFSWNFGKLKCIKYEC